MFWKSLLSVPTLSNRLRNADLETFGFLGRKRRRQDKLVVCSEYSASSLLTTKNDSTNSWHDRWFLRMLKHFKVYIYINSQRGIFYRYLHNKSHAVKLWLSKYSFGMRWGRRYWGGQMTLASAFPQCACTYTTWARRELKTNVYCAQKGHGQQACRGQGLCRLCVSAGDAQWKGRSRMGEIKGQLERQQCQGWFLNPTNPGMLRSGHLLVMLFPDLVIVILCIWVPAWMSAHHMCARCPQRPEEVSDGPKLEFQTFVSHHVSSGNWTPVFYQSSQWS